MEGSKLKEIELVRVRARARRARRGARRAGADEDLPRPYRRSPCRRTIEQKSQSSRDSAVARLRLVASSSCTRRASRTTNGRGGSESLDPRTPSHTNTLDTDDVRLI
ncbi:hypothetical protein EVAR_85270_1 [Eumeta japonica]|uniref:Uncharacterized protein n=1 Tax=Eumeta variegata TaxID=151549 RepID=A0A4C1V7L9_EUMVA|nr:hypothetical protein EVAR_85270_1 [Eumeta japonica]